MRPLSPLLLIPSLVLLTIGCQSDAEIFSGGGGSVPDNYFGRQIGARRAVDPPPAPVVPTVVASPQASPSATNNSVAGVAVGSHLNPYPHSTCPICDGGLEEKGGAITTSYGSQEIKICCAECEASFDADPIPALIKL